MPYNIEEISATNYPQLDKACYLDHAGTTVPSKLLINESAELLCTTLLANPHSNSMASKMTQQIIQETKLAVLRLFKCDPLKYDVIFTQNSTHSVKILVQDGFYCHGFDYYYSFDSHTSLIGVREYAQLATQFHYNEKIPLKHRLLLVAYTGQSNFNGERNDFSNIYEATNNPNVYTLLDALSLATTNPPDLSANAADFVTCSFYKMFGMPDLGGLIYNKLSGAKIFSKKVYFGGGTVDVVTSDYVARASSLATRLEDGTLPIHSISVLNVAIKLHHQLFGSFNDISERLTKLGQYAAHNLFELRHSNGSPMLKIHGEISHYGDSSKQGPIVTFNLLNSKGEEAGYYDFEKFVAVSGVSIRTGTLCNIGGFLHFSSLTEENLITNYSKYHHKCGDSKDVLNGKATGAIRISFGAMTRYSDVDFFISLIKEYFADTLISNGARSNSPVYVKSMYIYPIKSCHYFQIPVNVPWEISETGLKYDRVFCLLDAATLVPLRLKNCTSMVKVKPIVEHDQLIVTNGSESVTVPLVDVEHHYHTTRHNDFLLIIDDRLNQFFTALIDSPCVLAYSPVPQQNTSPFLLICQASIDRLQILKDLHHLFRANLLIDGWLLAFEEDSWSSLRASDFRLESMSKCDRCHMITINPETGSRDLTAYKTLNRERKLNGKVYFGQHLKLTQEGRHILKTNDKFSIEYAK